LKKGSPQLQVLSGNLLDEVGRQGELTARKLLTSLRVDNHTWFEVAPLGDKWETTDFYAELRPINNFVPVALFQVKTAIKRIRKNARFFKCQVPKKDIIRMMQIPVPIYILGVCEQSERVFAIAIEKTRKNGLTKISTKNEITFQTLPALHADIVSWWQSAGKNKPKFL
jgi:hypothetical protein